jgi:hypothetical protein
MYRSKAWLTGLLAAGLLAGFAGTALGYDTQQQSGMRYGYGMGQHMMMGPGMDRDGGMHPGMPPGPGYGQGMSYGMHYQRGMHHGMHPGMHDGRGYGQGMSYGMHHQRGMHQAQRPGMHPGYGIMMGSGTGKGMGPGLIYGWPAGGEQDLSVEDARGWLDRRLAWHGNPRLKLGEVREVDEDTIVAEIVTRDGSLVQKLAIDRRSGVLRQLDD